MQVERSEVDRDGSVRLIGKRFMITPEVEKALVAAAKKGCNDCHGRGYSGRETITGMYLKCGCIPQSIEEIVDEVTRKSVDEVIGKNCDGQEA